MNWNEPEVSEEPGEKERMVVEGAKQQVLQNNNSFDESVPLMENGSLDRESWRGCITASFLSTSYQGLELGVVVIGWKVDRIAIRSNEVHVIERSLTNLPHQDDMTSS